MAPETKLWHLENFNLFHGMSMKDMKEVAKKTTMRTAKKDQYIFFPEEPSTAVYFLKEGKVKLGSYSEDGKELIKAILSPGEVFGELSVTGEDTRRDFAQAMDDGVLICTMGRDEMVRMMTVNPIMGMKITKLIGVRLRKTERRLSDLLFKDARTRVIDLIREMAQESGKMIGHEVLVRHNFTHKDMANLTATSRQTVTTILNELKEKDLIYTERKKILIRDLEKLE